MDNISQLLIRACKSRNPDRRLRSVYRRFYGRYNTLTEGVALADVLVHLVDEVAPMKVSEYLREVSTYKSYYNMTVLCRKRGAPIPEEEPSYIITMWIMRDKLRHLVREDFKRLGVSSPARWRNK